MPKSAEQIRQEYTRRHDSLCRSPGLIKLIHSAQKRYGIESSYELDALISVFLLNNYLPKLNEIGQEVDELAEDIRRESGYTREPEEEEIVRHYIDKISELHKDSTRFLVASLFGELDGDRDVEEYVKIRADELRKGQMAVTEVLHRQQKEGGDRDSGRDHSGPEGP